MVPCKSHVSFFEQPIPSNLLSLRREVSDREYSLDRRLHCKPCTELSLVLVSC